VPRGKTGPPRSLGDISAGTRPSRFVESNMKQQNMVLSSAGLGDESDCSGKAQKQLHEQITDRQSCITLTLTSILTTGDRRARLALSSGTN
jgi:hypothetical protein